MQECKVRERDGIDGGCGGGKRGKLGKGWLKRGLRKRCEGRREGKKVVK